MLEVFDDNGELFKVEDTSGLIALTDAAAGDQVRVGSGQGSSLAGALPNGGAASNSSPSPSIGSYAESDQ